MRYRPFLVLALLLTALAFSGCYDLREPEETGIVAGFGIDQLEDGRILLIAQTVIPQPPGTGGGAATAGGQVPFHNFYSTGKTVFDAVRNLSLQSPNQMFFSHGKVIILSERLARKGMQDVIDFLERDPEINPSSWLLIARDGLPNILHASEFRRESPTQLLSDVIERRDRNSKYAVSRLKDFIMMLDSPGLEAYTAGVGIYKGIMKGREDRTENIPQARRFNELAIGETAAFKKDKLVGWLNPTESRGLLWIKGKVQQGLIIAEKENQRVTYEIFGSTAKVKPEVKDGQLVIKVDLQVKGNLGEISPGLYNVNDKIIEELEGLIAETIKSQVLAAVIKAQELNTDILGFGEAVYRKFPEQWHKGLREEWPEMFKDIEVEVAAKVRIKGMGIITTSVKPGSDK